VENTLANCFEAEAAGFGGQSIQEAAAEALIAAAKSEGATFEDLKRESSGSAKPRSTLPVWFNLTSPQVKQAHHL
jgi:hypothetical protein